IVGSVGDAAKGVFGSGIGGLPEIMVASGSNPYITLQCGNTCSRLAATFRATGAFSDTVFAQTIGEVGSATLTLKGFPAWSDFPDRATVLDVLAPAGGASTYKSYAQHVSGSYAAYEWVEADQNG